MSTKPWRFSDITITKAFLIDFERRIHILTLNRHVVEMERLETSLMQNKTYFYYSQPDDSTAHRYLE